MPYKSNTKTLLKVRDPQDELTKLENNISGVESKVDAADKSIRDEVWKDTFIEITDADGNVIKKRMEDMLIQNSISLTVQENFSNYSSVVQDMKSIKQTVEQNKGEMETIVQQITDVDEGWKVCMKRIGASTDTSSPTKETSLMLNEEGVFVAFSTKEGQKVKITADAFEGIYNEGLSDSKDIYPSKEK